MNIAKHKVVAIEYTLTDPAGNVLDTSIGRPPLAYIHGVGGIIPGLEAALDGKSIGEKLHVTIPPEQAYGPKDKNLVQSVPREMFKTAPDIQPGMQFQATAPNGATRNVLVTAVSADTVTVDANHPLAGVTLTFDVTIIAIRDATQEEIDHRHAHGAGGHQH